MREKAVDALDDARQRLYYMTRCSSDPQVNAHLDEALSAMDEVVANLSLAKELALTSERAAA